MKIIIFLGLTIFSLNSFADRIVGNGGDILQCQKNSNSPVTFELFDLFEARDQRGMEIDYPENVKGPLAIAEEVIKRLEKISPRRVETYLEWARNFEKEALFKSNINLTNIDDSLHFYTPVHCQLKQIAIQQTPRFFGDKRYVVNKDLWDAGDDYQRAALITHEIIYREYLNLHGTSNVDSRSVRYFNSILWSNRAKDFTVKQFIKFIQELRFEYAEHNGVKIQVYTPEDDLNDEMSWDPVYYDSGEMWSAKVIWRQKFSQGGHDFMLSNDWDILPWKNTIYFHKNGKVSELKVWAAQKIHVNGVDITIYNKAYFYENGNLKQVSVAGNYNLIINGKEVVDYTGELRFDEEGNFLPKVDR